MPFFEDSLAIWSWSVALSALNLMTTTSGTTAAGSEMAAIGAPLGRPPGSALQGSGYTHGTRPSDGRHAPELRNRLPETFTMTLAHAINETASGDGVDRPTDHFRPLIRVFTMDARCRMYEFVVSFVLLGVTCLFGFVGNVLSILTLRRDSIKSVTTFLLSALAVADTAFLVPVVFVILVPTACEFYQNCPDRLNNVIPILEQFGWAITGTCHTCTVYVTVLVAVHRYLWVCRLSAARRLSGFRRTRIQVAIVPLFALLYNSPRFLEYKVVHYSWNDTASGASTIRKETTKILATVGRNDFFQIGYKNVLFIVVMYIVPLAILVMVSVNLIRTLRTRRDTLRRIGSTSSTASTSRRDDNITFVLIIIIAAFIVCQTPIMIQRLILAVSGTSGSLGCGTFYFYFEHFAYYMVLLNSSTNFVIYILFSPHFRQTLVADVIRKRRPTTSDVLESPQKRSSPPLPPPTTTNEAGNVKRNDDERETVSLIRMGRRSSEGAGGEGKTENDFDGNLRAPEVNGGIFGSAVFSNCSRSTNQESLLMSEYLDDGEKEYRDE